MSETKMSDYEIRFDTSAYFNKRLQGNEYARSLRKEPEIGSLGKPLNSVKEGKMEAFS